jgi:hypothetical protein
LLIEIDLRQTPVDHFSDSSVLAVFLAAHEARKIG